jgi:hypothetical protein
MPEMECPECGYMETADLPDTCKRCGKATLWRVDIHEKREKFTATPFWERVEKEFEPKQ